MPHTWESEEQLLAEFQRDVAARAADFGRLTMHLTLAEAWPVLGALQLALSHPGNTGAGADVQRHFAELLAEAIAQTPAEKQMVQLGWREAEHAKTV